MFKTATMKLGTLENPIYKNGKAYAYNKRGNLVMIEDFDSSTTEKFTLTRDMKATPEQVKMLKEAKKRPLVFDADCPASTDEYLEGMRPFWKKYESTPTNENK